MKRSEELIKLQDAMLDARDNLVVLVPTQLHCPPLEKAIKDLEHHARSLDTAIGAFQRQERNE